VEQSPATVVITNAKGEIEYVNPKFVQLTGYSFEEALGKNPRILKSGFQNEEFYKNLWSTILAGNEWRGEFHNRKKNGDYYWEFASISPIRDAKGRITHFIAVKEDVTMRKQAEAALAESEKKLRIRNEIMEKDLKLAQIIQRSFIPEKVPRFEGLNIEYRYQPLDKVGGDFFSFAELADNAFGIFQCDVAGHGVAAALFMSLVKSATDRIARMHPNDPEIFLGMLNTMLIEEMQQLFITGVYSVFYLHDNGVQVEFANGGHPPLVWYRAANQSVELVKSPGTVIGMIESARYKKMEIIMERGDRLFIFTDGIPEVENSTKQMIGFEEDLTSLFGKSYRRELGDMLDAVLENVRNFAGDAEIDDDILIIGIEVTG
jgi:PAS domain S-box-containing protein